MTIIVNAIQGKNFMWAWSDMIEKRLKVIVPFIAHGYSSTTIIFEVFKTWIETTTFGRFPCRIFFSWFTTKCVTMRLAMRALNTATTLGSSRQEITTINISYIATPTVAPPSGSPLFVAWGTFYNGQIAKLFVNKVDEIGRRCHYCFPLTGGLYL